MFRELKGRYVVLISGEKIYYDDFLISPLAAAQHMEKHLRFSGAVKFGWTPLHHTLLAYVAAEYEGESREVLREILIHDVPEAVLGDQPAPFKLNVQKLLELDLLQKVRDNWNIPDTDSVVLQKVKQYDLASRSYEGNNKNIVWYPNMRKILGKPPEWDDFLNSVLSTCGKEFNFTNKPSQAVEWYLQSLDMCGVKYANL